MYSVYSILNLVPVYTRPCVYSCTVYTMLLNLVVVEVVLLQYFKTKFFKNSYSCIHTKFSTMVPEVPVDLISAIGHISYVITPH